MNQEVLFYKILYYLLRLLLPQLLKSKVNFQENIFVYFYWSLQEFRYKVKKELKKKNSLLSGGQKSSPALNALLFLFLLFPFSLSVLPSSPSVSKPSNHERKNRSIPLINLLFMHVSRGVEIYMCDSTLADTRHAFTYIQVLKAGRFFLIGYLQARHV